MLACPNAISEILVLEYAEFGPQVASYRLLGPEWWQWQSHGDSDPRSQYLVQVVVYDEESERDLRHEYPIIPSENKDYRLIPLNQALQYLDEEIKKDIFEPTTARLKKTRTRIRRHFNVIAEVE